MPQPTARDRFLAVLRAALTEGTLTKLTLGKYRGPDATLRNLFIRPVTLKAGPHFAFLWRHATRDVVKNHPPTEALAEVEALLGRDFLDAHLFTPTQTAQFEAQPDGTARMKLTRASDAATTAPAPVPLAPAAHDRAKAHLIPPDAPWLHSLGVVNDRGQPREGMADKFRQIQKFAELLTHLLTEAFPASPSPSSQSPSPATPPLRIADMGSGKGYLTFALAHVLGERAHVRGIELRPELVELCNRLAHEHHLASRLTFYPGSIADTPLAPGDCDVLIALHACDTATDDALARGLAAGAQLLVVAPCCQKELRRQLTPPAVLAPALRHGIFQERQSEFVTDALRALLLECAGYRTKVFEFISTEHTAKNLMIAAIKTPDTDP
ncbi:MAG: SAM-dependent methyltransferase, partial [Verrucomicrobiota bacterium]